MLPHDREHRRADLKRDHGQISRLSQDRHEGKRTLTPLLHDSDQAGSDDWLRAPPLVVRVVCFIWFGRSAEQRASEPVNEPLPAAVSRQPNFSAEQSSTFGTPTLA
jgi:hypothetical protein